MKRNVTLPPRDPGAYLRMLKQQTAKLSKELQVIDAAIRRADDEVFADVFHDVSGIDDWDVERAVSLTTGAYPSVVDNVDSIGLTIDIAFSYKNDPYRVQQEIGRIIKRIDEILEQLTNEEVVKVVEVFDSERDALDRSFMEGYEYNPEGFSPEDYELLMSFPSAVVEFTQFMTDAQEALGAQLHLMREKRLPAESVDTLYHASTRARQLYEQGFDPSGAAGKAGIGQFGGALPQTSFTADEEMAGEIAQCLLEAVLIARGEVDARELMDHADEDGVLDKTMELYRHGFGKFPDDPTREQVFTLYKDYLAAAEMAGVRFNPLFVSVYVDAFADVDPADVGYLECQVKMDPQVEYLHAMFEYRVEPRHILECPRWAQAETSWR